MAPYAAFTILVVLCNYLYLGQGFNATDEGYLLSAGQRIVRGEFPYINFFFLRTPLSIYIQAGLIKLLGDSYTVLASRVFWAIQMWGMAIIVSSLYRRYVGRFETFLLLSATYIVSIQLLAFPWYSYDAAFFAVTAIVLLVRRHFLLAGIMMFLATMAKQNYGLLLPMYVVLSWLVGRLLPRLRYLKVRDVTYLAAGFVIPSGLYLLYLWHQGSLWYFVQNVFILPAEASQVQLSFTLAQNNPGAAMMSLPLMAALALLYYFNRRSVVAKVVTGLFVLAAVSVAFLNYRDFIFSLVYLNYAAIVLTVIELYRTRQGNAKTLVTILLPAAVAGFVVQYLAGFNYAGVEYGYMTASVGLVVGYLSFRELSPSSSRRTVALALLAGVLLFGLYFRYDVVYRDGFRSELTAHFRTPKLRGITSTPRNVDQVDNLVDAVSQLAPGNSTIFVFPDFPILYYLTDKRNATPIDWYTPRELGERMIPEALGSLERSNPKLVLLQMYPESDFRRNRSQLDYRTIKRYVPFIGYIAKRYKMLKQVGDVVIFIRDDETAPKS